MYCRFKSQNISTSENHDESTVFTTLHFLHILNTNPVTKSVTLHLTESPKTNTLAYWADS
jgi:hypothetical protein